MANQKKIEDQLITSMQKEETSPFGKPKSELLVPPQLSGRSEEIEAFGSIGFFDFDEPYQRGDYGNMYLWVQPNMRDQSKKDTYYRYLDKDLSGGRWELSGQKEEYDAYRKKPSLIEAEDHWGKSDVGKRIRQAIEKDIEWEDLPKFLEGYNTWRSISPNRDIEKELKELPDEHK